MKRSKMKILYLCADSGISFWGIKGGSIHIREFVKALLNENHDVSVIVRTDGNEATDDSALSLYTLPDDRDEALFKSAKKLKGDKKSLDELKSFHQNPYRENLLLELYAKNKFDLIYERYSLFNTAGLKFAEARGIPFVLEVNAPLVVETSRYRKLVNVELARAVERYLFGGADHIIAVSDELRKYILKIAPQARVTVAPNGVSVERFQDVDKHSNSIDSLANFAESGFVVGFVGSIRPWHGVDILIDSFAGLAHKDTESKLIIIGDEGKMKPQLEKQCHDQGLNGRIIFTGAVAYEDVPALMHRADVLVAPYPEMNNFYFSALKIFEYMAAGKPIVASRIGQIPEILTDECTALLVSPGDKQALCDALLRLKNEPELRLKLGKNARDEACKKHTWKQRIEIITGIFKELISGNSLKKRK